LSRRDDLTAGSGAPEHPCGRSRAQRRWSRPPSAQRKPPLAVAVVLLRGWGTRRAPSRDAGHPGGLSFVSGVDLHRVAVGDQASDAGEVTAPSGGPVRGEPQDRAPDHAGDHAHQEHGRPGIGDSEEGEQQADQQAEPGAGEGASDGRAPLIDPAPSPLRRGHPRPGMPLVADHRLVARLTSETRSLRCAFGRAPRHLAGRPLAAPQPRVAIDRIRSWATCRLDPRVALPRATLPDGASLTDITAPLVGPGYEARS
jgi:hypothetical protein